MRAESNKGTFRRRFRFRTRSLLILVVIVAVFSWAAAQRPYFNKVIIDAYEGPATPNYNPDGTVVDNPDGTITIYQMSSETYEYQLNPRLLWFSRIALILLVGLMVQVLYRKIRKGRLNRKFPSPTSGGGKVESPRR